MIIDDTLLSPALNGTLLSPVLDFTHYHQFRMNSDSIFNSLELQTTTRWSVVIMGYHISGENQQSIISRGHLKSLSDLQETFEVINIIFIGQLWSSWRFLSPLLNYTLVCQMSMLSPFRADWNQSEGVSAWNLHGLY